MKNKIQISSMVCLIGIIALILVGYVMYMGKSLLVPLLIAIFLAYLILPILNLSQKIKLPAFLTVFFVLIVFFGVISLFGYSIYQNIQDFIEESGKYGMRFDNLLNNFNVWLRENFNVHYNPVDILKVIAEKINIPAYISAGVGEFFNFFSSLVLVFFYLSFILLERGMILKKIKKIASLKNGKNSVTETVSKINEQIQKYIALKTMISAATGIVVYIALKIIGVDFAELWAILAFLLNFIPNIGSIIATIPPIIIALLQFGSFWQAGITAIVLIAIEMIIGNVLEPKILGWQLNLSPLVVFFSLILWGAIWGVTGMILSVPIMASISIITGHIPFLRGISIALKEKV